MNWCNCNHDNYYNLSTSINEDSLTCWTCANRITNEDLIQLLIKEVKRLDAAAEDLEFKRNNTPDIDDMYEKAQQIEEYFKEQINRVDACKEKEKVVEEARREDIRLKSTVEVLEAKMVDLEFKSHKLRFTVEKLESEKNEREAIKLSKEQKRIKELEKELRVMEKQTERFEMMDL